MATRSTCGTKMVIVEPSPADRLMANAGRFELQNIVGLTKTSAVEKIRILSACGRTWETWVMFLLWNWSSAKS